MACRTCVGGKCRTPQACLEAEDDGVDMLGRLLLYALAIVLLVAGGIWLA